MEDVFRITLLYDFYGELLTEKQKTIFEMYHLNDLSLQEIADEFNISRQAVSDLIKRTKKLLETYEERLSLMENFLDQKSKFEKIHETIKDISELKGLDNNSKDKLTEVNKLLNGFLD